MFDRPPRVREAISWGYAAFWAGLTFVTVPYVRVGVTYVTENLGESFFTYKVVTLVVMATFAVLYLIRHRSTFWSSLCLIGIAGLIIYLAFGLAGESPVEAVHYVQYGTLSILLFRAFSHRVRDYSIYVAVILTGTLAGMVDETIQWLTPDRVFDLRDVWLNFKATALVQIGLAAGVRPGLIWGLPGWANLRRLCYLSALTLGYLGLCLQNTPDRISWYSAHVPGLGFVDPTRNIMVEYGHLHGDEGTVSFRSRLTLEELRQSSESSAGDGALNLDDIHEREILGGFNWREFLLTNTYLYEGRLHQLRRDQNLRRAERGQDGHNQPKHFAAAHWENVILIEYFSPVLLGTRYEWSHQTENGVQAGADLDTGYTSSISTHLVVAFSRRQLAFLSFGGVVLFLLGAAICHRMTRQSEGK